VPSLPLLPCRSADPFEAPQRSQTLNKPSTSSRKRKQGQEQQEAEHPSPRIRDQPSSKRVRAEPSSCAEEELHPGAASDTSENSPDPLQYWIQNGRWRKEYFEQDSQVREDFERGKSPEELEQRDWLQDYCLREPFRPMHGFHHLQHLFARKRSSSSLRRKNSESSLQTPSDQLPREVKSAQYRTVEYEIGLEKKGSYMREFDDDIPEDIKTFCKNLLEAAQTLPQDSLFRDNLFKKTCEKIRNRNETMVIRDIGSLMDRLQIHQERVRYLDADSAQKDVLFY